MLENVKTAKRGMKNYTKVNFNDKYLVPTILIFFYQELELYNFIT